MLLKIAFLIKFKQLRKSPKSIVLYNKKENTIAIISWKSMFFEGVISYKMVQ